MNTPRWFLALALTAAWLAGAAFGQNTVGGTTIENTATATFVDSNDVARSTFSNTVETTVQTVYAYTVAPDDGSAPTAASDFAGYVDTDGLNDVAGAIGDTVTFLYTITNDTNNDATNPVNLSLSVAQYAGDDFDLTGVAIEVSFDGGTTWVPYVPANGLDLTAQGQVVQVRVTGEIPAGVDGNEVALVDLVVVNESAIAAGQLGPNVSFETNNIGSATVEEAPSLGIAKDASAVTNNGDGSYTVDYVITAQNYGNVPLSSVQVVDDLTAAFPGVASLTVDGVVATGSLTANASFDGDADTDLLVAASSTLPVGGAETVTVTVTITPGADLGPYDNQATATATSPGATAVSDVSTVGADPDQNGDDAGNDGDGDPTNTDSVTPVLFGENPVIGLAKAATGAVAAPGFPGQFLTTITLTLRNYGDVELRGVSVTDVLTTTFPAPASYVVDVGAGRHRHGGGQRRHERPHRQRRLQRQHRHGAPHGQQHPRGGGDRDRRLHGPLRSERPHRALQQHRRDHGDEPGRHPGRRRIRQRHRSRSDRRWPGQRRVPHAHHLHREPDPRPCQEPRLRSSTRPACPASSTSPSRSRSRTSATSTWTTCRSRTTWPPPSAPPRRSSRSARRRRRR